MSCAVFTVCLHSWFDKPCGERYNTVMDTNVKIKRISYGWVLLAALLALLAALLLAPTPAHALQFEEAIITGDLVNMRLRPTADSPVILQFKESTRVGVFCEETDGWYRIIYGNYRGYVSTEYVYLSSTDTLVGHVLHDETPVYRSAGKYGSQVATLSAGNGITIVNVSGDYYGVEFEAPGSDKEETGETAEPSTSEEEPSESTAHSGDAEQATMRGYILKDAVETSSAKTAVSLLKEGMEGVEVKKMQSELRKRGFLGASATGYFGDQTKQAVVDFQRKAKIAADGIAGSGTLELLYGDNDIRTTAAERAGITGKVQLSNWDTIKNVFAKGKYATVTDVRTGIQYKVYRFGGWYHADCVPASAADTAKMKKAYGGSWSWDRRAIWVTVGGRTYAASQNGMPHMVDYSKNDNFVGHFCIHFKGSKVHENSKECPRHQAKVQYAYSRAQ